MRISDEDYIAASDFQFAVQDGFLRNNFVFEVLQEGELIARPTEDHPWDQHSLTPSNEDAVLTADEERIARWWDESGTLAAVRAPLNPEKRLPKPRKRPVDEISDHFEDSSSEEEPPKKKKKVNELKKK